jgi:hypothetical protein
LATWLAEAFSVLGYPWPNGERGSGKTHWLTCWARTSYLGEVLLSSGTFAALRDMADYGAALAFDDAEILSDPKRCDPNKRELLLAGNRHGAAVPLKEPRADGRGWETRWTNAFCPKAYSAIRLPDPVLGSRSVIVPLVRTSDKQRGNADPSEDRRWPCDRVALQDDLWATALYLLPEAASVWGELDTEDVVGRVLEPWRAVLAVARLFDGHGVGGLESRMRQVMAAYQREAPDLLEDDGTVQVVRALLVLAFGTSDGLDGLDGSDGLQEEVAFSAAQIADMVKCEEDGSETADWGEGERGRRERTKAAARVGYILKRLRIESERAPTRKRERRRVGSRGDILAIARTYGLGVAGNPSEPSASVHPSDASEAGPDDWEPVAARLGQPGWEAEV